MSFSDFPRTNAALKGTSLLKAFLPIFFRVILLTTIFAGTPAFAEKRKPGVTAPAPPPPIPRKVTMDRGHQITIPLGVYGPGVAQMEFIIRTGPKSGKLSPVQITGERTAAVTYFAPDNEDVFDDKFTYAVRTADGVSAPVPITITFSEAAGIPPRLIVPGALEMEAIRPGGRATTNIEIRNAGGGFAEGELTVTEPWKVDGPANFRLGGGAKTEFSVSYAGKTPGTEKGTITYGGRFRVSTTLTATVLPPITLAPALLELKVKPGVTTRTAQVRITNETAEPIAVRIEHGPRLLTDSTVTIQGNATQSIAVFAEPGEVGQVEDKLQLSAAGWNTELPVIAPPLGPIIQSREKSVALPPASVNRVSQGSFTLENTGGSTVTLSVSTAEPFSAEPSAFALKPKGNTVITVAAKSSAAGTFEGTVKISGNAIQQEIPVSAEFTAKAAEATQPSAVTKLTKVAETIETQPASPESERKNTQASMDLSGASASEVPNIAGKARDIQPTSAVIAWKGSNQAGMRAQIRIVRGSANGLTIDWRDVPASFSQDGESVLCKLDSLAPATAQTYRIIAGNTVLCTVAFTTPQKPPFPIGLRSVILVALTATAAWLLWKRWKATARTGW